MRILLITDPIPTTPFRAALLARAPELELLDFSPALSDAELADIDVVLGWRLPAGLAARLPRLRWVCSVAAGVEKLLVADLAPSVVVSRIVDTEQAAGIAQFVALMALRHARALPAYEALQRAHRWQREPAGPVRSRVGVLGTGTMGGAVARLLGLVGFEVQGWSRRTGHTLDAVLARSDIVVCALPLTAQTQQLLDARAFARMPRGSYLINIARGAHVVEADLIQAIRGGHLAGAALDVQCHEPMPTDDPLWDVPGITITPHVAAQSSPETIAVQFLAGLDCVARGEPAPHRVDRAAGY
jgi:phosphoglycerate dehydrogenase-like enzyme